MNPARIDSRTSPTASIGDSISGRVRAVLCSVACVLVIASAQAQSARTTADQRMLLPQKTLIAQRVATLRTTRDVLRATAASPLPRDLSTAELTQARRYTAWLQTWAARLDALANKGEGAIGAVGGAAGSSGAIGGAAGDGGGQDQLLAATGNMQETQMSFNLQYLQLQSAMQNENRQFTTVSNIMKTKHDTVKNSISNIR